MFLLFPLLAGDPHPELRIDPLLLAQAVEVFGIVGRDDNPVWPGWNARSTPILFYLPGVQDALVNHPSPPQGFVRVPCELLPSGWTLDLRAGTTEMALDGQNTSTQVAGVETLVVADTVSNLRPQLALFLSDPRPASEREKELTLERLALDPYDQLSLIVHEAFHVHQARVAPNKAASEAWLLQYPWLAAENNAGFVLEARALTRALTCGEIDEAYEAALEFLAVRSERRAKLPTQAVAYEDGTEFNEGLAKYTEWRLSKELEGREPHSALRWARGFRGYRDLGSLRTRLLQQLEGNCTGAVIVNGDPYGSGGLRFRLYYTGMALGGLLDRLEVTDWRERIFESGTTLTGILRELLAPPDSELAAAAARARAENGYAQVLAQKQKLEADGQADARARAQAIQASPVLFTLDYALAQPSVGFNYTPFGLTRVDADRTIYSLIPLRGELGERAWFQQESASPTLHDVKAGRIQFALAAPLDEAGLARLLEVEKLPEGTLDELDLALPGARVHATRATVASVRGGVEVKLVP
jgi:hypothetical protein